MLSFKSLRQALLMGVATLGTAAAVSTIEQPAFAQEVTRTYNIQAQDLNSALREFALQTGRDVLYPPEIVAGKRSNGAQGQLTERQALEALLAGTGLRFEQTASNGYAVQDPNSPTQLGDARRVSPSEALVEGEEIVVIGTNIRGVYPESSPVTIYTADDIERTGAATIEQFVRKLPSNFGTTTQYAAGGSIAGSQEGVNGIDLRGLGVGTSLVLLNGRRLAPASNGRVVDISLIPASAIARVEILTDGASAIYGADAVGGVVNFVLRDDFEGLETQLNYGGVTAGGLRQGNLTQSFGEDWRSGRAFLSLDAYSASALYRADRDYTESAGAGTLTPVEQRYSALASITQELGDRLTLNGDFAYSLRDVKNDTVVVGSANPQFELAQSQAEQYFANVGLDIDLAVNLNSSILLSYSDIDVDSRFIQRVPATGLVRNNNHDTNYTTVDLTANINGTAFSLPAGAVRFSVGGGYMEEQFSGRRATASTSRDLGRVTTYAFGELLVPLTGEQQNVPLAERLELSLAARYTNFDDASSPSLGREFGSDTSPKIGLLWSPIGGLNLRGTYGESFRAPSLTQLDTTSASNRLLVGAIPVGGVISPFLQVMGPSPNLGPETAETYTLGFDYRPTAESDFRISATYFSIDYGGRISVGFTGVAPIFDPASYPSVLFHPTSPAVIAEILATTPNALNNSGINLSSPTAAADVFALPNLWILDARDKNLSASQLDGLDVSIGDRFSLPFGEIIVGADVTRIFEYRQKILPTSPAISAVDNVLQPADLRARVYLGVERDNLSATLGVNYVDDYANPYAAGGSQTVDSWTTVDFNTSFRFDSGDAWSGVRLSLSIQNMFDEDPPHVADSALDQALTQPVGFDPANANPLGRLVMVGIAKRW